MKLTHEKTLPRVGEIMGLISDYGDALKSSARKLTFSASCSARLAESYREDAGKDIKKAVEINAMIFEKLCGILDELHRCEDILRQDEISRMTGGH